MDGYGTGYALVQLRVFYSVEYNWQLRQAPYEAFEVTVDTRLSGRNFSRIDYGIYEKILYEQLKKIEFTR